MKQLISLLLSNALVLLLCTGSFGASFRGEQETKEIGDVKTQIEKLHTRTARIEIKLRGKTKLKGYVQEIGEDDVVISDLKTNTRIRVAYTEIQQVKEIQDHHLFDRKLFIIGAVIGTAFLIAGTYPDKP